MEVTEKMNKKAQEILERYPVSKRSAAMPLLHLVQENHGYISLDAMKWISSLIGVKPIQILELVTFYPGYRQKPTGKHHFRICRTLSCAMADSEKIMSDFCKKNNIDLSKMTHDEPIAVSPDGNVSVEYVECLASCGTAPVCLYQNKLREKIDTEKLNLLMRS